MRALLSVLLIISSAALAQPPFTLQRVQSVNVPYRDKPGHAVMLAAKFQWQGQDARWVAWVTADACRRDIQFRTALIGREDTTLAGNEPASYADRPYDWALNGPTPSDQLFTAVCAAGTR